LREALRGTVENCSRAVAEVARAVAEVAVLQELSLGLILVVVVVQVVLR
jgi:hypothetical protein